MTALDWMYLFGAAGQLTIAGLCFVRGKTSLVARPLGLLCLTMFGWCFCSLAARLTGGGAWGILDSVLSALSPPCALHLVATFVGARRAYVRAVVAEYAYFSLVSLTTAGAFVSPALRLWVDSSAWAEIFLVGWVPALGLIFVLLVRHLVGATDPDEKARARLMLAAIAIAAVLATSDIVRDLGFALPHLAPIGALASALVVATAAFRFRMFDRDLSASAALYTTAVAGVGVVAYLGVFRVLGGNVAATAFGTAVVTSGLGAAVYELSTSIAAARAKVDRLVVLGRFSSQMAHDMKNPLATLKGALQFLEEEHARGRSLDHQHGFLRLMLDQVDRLGRLTQEYERVGRVEPLRRAVDLNQIVRGVMALEPFAAENGVAIQTELEASLPHYELDADLVARAIENLVRNAFEAMPRGGKLTVRTSPATSTWKGGVIVSVEDQGTGMDARQAERAFDEFYTTKATGSGLGLPFVRRVAEAHGGEASLRTRVGEGTVVELRLPAPG